MCTYLVIPIPRSVLVCIKLWPITRPGVVIQNKLIIGLYLKSNTTLNNGKVFKYLCFAFAQFQFKAKKVLIWVSNCVKHMWKFRFSRKLKSGWKSWIRCRPLGVFNIELPLNLDIRALTIGSRMNLESGPPFAEVWSVLNYKFGTYQNRQSMCMYLGMF